MFRSGLASMKCATSGSSAAKSALLVNQLLGGTSTVFRVASTSYFARFYFRLDNAPFSNVKIIEYDADISVKVTTGGALQLWNSNTNTQIGSDSSAIATDGSTWYRIELKVTLNGSQQVTACELQLDGTSVASTSGLTIATSTGAFTAGWVEAPGTSKVLYIDDTAVNSSAGSDQNSWPGSGKVVLLTPTSDSARGTGWVNDANGTTNFFDATDNIPPAGIADTTSSSGVHQIRNGTSNANSSVDLNLKDYTTAGIGSGDTINVVLPIVSTGAPVSTSAKQGTIGVVSNPAITNISLGTLGTSGAFWQGNAAGTWASGWKWSYGTPTYVPAVTLGTSPVIRITQVTSSTRVAMVCFLGMHVDYTPSSSRVPRSPGVDSGNAHL